MVVKNSGKIENSTFVNLLDILFLGSFQVRVNPGYSPELCVMVTNSQEDYFSK
jgi:hypothetical protein